MREDFGCYLTFAIEITGPFSYFTIENLETPNDCPITVWDFSAMNIHDPGHENSNPGP